MPIVIGKEMLKFIYQRVQQNILSLVPVGVLFFAFAGTLKIWGFWIYAATVLTYQILSLLIIVPRFPAYVELAHLRKVQRGDAKKWDRHIVRLLMVATLLIYVLAAVDLGRLYYCLLPLWMAPIGILLYAAGSALNQWAMIHNPHFEKEVRIQVDRNHQVIAAGPYRHIRHPGYLGSLLGFVSFPFILGSAFAFIGVIFAIAGTVVRTHLEDRTLDKELVGYYQYRESVPYRLIPFVW